MMHRTPPTTQREAPHRSSGRIALAAVVVSLGLSAACATEVVDQAGPKGTRYGSADAAAQALTPNVELRTVAPRYGSADAAAHVLTPRSLARYGSADAAAHALTPALPVIGPSTYGSADAAEHALAVVHQPADYGSADAAAHALGG